MARTTNLAAPVAAPADTQSVNLSDGHLRVPEFVALPREDQVEFYSSLRRSMLNTLILPCAANGHKPPVKSISLKRPGLSKGKRLIATEGVFGNQLGLLTYLRKLRDEQPAETAGASSEAH